jgi:hypothetical protein
MLHDPNWDKKPEVLDQVSLNLLAAAEYIEKHGWCQKRASNSLGQVCLFGALNRVTNNLSNSEYDRVYKVLNDQPINWNDEPGRTKEEVVNALRKAATSPA